MNRTDYIYAQPMQFQRGERKARIKKIKRKIPLKVKHICLSAALLAVLFFSLQKFYLFLISWENLNIKDIQVLCANEAVKDEIRQSINPENLGNILLLDLASLQNRLKVSSWVKEARIRKIYPSSLRIEISVRKPAAFIKKENIYLIDEEGVELENVEFSAKTALPLLVDENNFIENYEGKLKLAWECLKSVSPEERTRVESIDLSEFENVVLRFKDIPTKVYLGSGQFSPKLAIFQRNIAAWKSQFGEMDYADLRFQDRVYLGFSGKPANAEVFPNPDKEVE